MSDSQYMDHDQDFTFGYQFPADQMKVRFVYPALQLVLLEVHSGTPCHALVASPPVGHLTSVYSTSAMC